MYLGEPPLDPHGLAAAVHGLCHSQDLAGQMRYVIRDTGVAYAGRGSIEVISYFSRVATMASPL
jgi:hypothetical protein